jgi:hypothetical protein
MFVLMLIKRELQPLIVCILFSSFMTLRLINCLGNDTVNTLFSPDVISFARNNGFYPPDKSDEEFSFSDTYNPLSFEGNASVAEILYSLLGARACEARVWSFFSKITTGMHDPQS